MSYKYYENKSCEYYPCHDLEHINCLFCYCPLYSIEDCGGYPSYIKAEDHLVKDCSKCSFPHIAENYDKVVAKLSCIKR